MIGSRPRRHCGRSGAGSTEPRDSQDGPNRALALPLGSLPCAAQQVRSLLEQMNCPIVSTL